MSSLIGGLLASLALLCYLTLIFLALNGWFEKKDDT